MKALILAAGYGTRLEKDIVNDTSGKYTHLKGLPKPLVPVGGTPLISHWMDILLSSKFNVGDVYLITNGINYELFVDWAKNSGYGFKVDNIVNDQSTGNHNRIGAIGDICLMFEKKKELLQNNLMIIGGDTLFFEDFDLSDVVTNFYERKQDNLVLCYHEEDTLKSGILETNDKNYVTAFLEKPDPKTTKSRKGCPCFYLYRKETLSLFDDYCAQTKSLQEKDAPGNFLCWLYSRAPVWVYEITGRFDIGGLETYVKCNQAYVPHKAISKKSSQDEKKQEQRVSYIYQYFV